MSFGAIYNLREKAKGDLPRLQANLFNAFISKNIFLTQPISCAYQGLTC